MECCRQCKTCTLAFAILRVGTGCSSLHHCSTNILMPLRNELSLVYHTSVHAISQMVLMVWQIATADNRLRPGRGLCCLQYQSYCLAQRLHQASFWSGYSQLSFAAAAAASHAGVGASLVCCCSCGCCSDKQWSSGTTVNTVIT